MCLLNTKLVFISKLLGRHNIKLGYKIIDKRTQLFKISLPFVLPTAWSLCLEAWFLFVSSHLVSVKIIYRGTRWFIEFLILFCCKFIFCRTCIHNNNLLFNTWLLHVVMHFFWIDKCCDKKYGKEQSKVGFNSLERFVCK